MNDGPRKPEDQLRQMADSFTDVMSSLRKKVGGMVEDLFAQDASGELAVAVDAYLTSAEFVIEIELPGVQKEDVSLQIIDQVLHVKGIKRLPAGHESFEYLGRERRVGEFMRTFELPGEIDLEKIKAKYEHGILRVSFSRILPASEKAGTSVNIE